MGHGSSLLSSDESGFWYHWGSTPCTHRYCDTTAHPVRCDGKCCPNAIPGQVRSCFMGRFQLLQRKIFLPFSSTGCCSSQGKMTSPQTLLRNDPHSTASKEDQSVLGALQQIKRSPVSPCLHSCHAQKSHPKSLVTLFSSFLQVLASN